MLTLVGFGMMILIIILLLKSKVVPAVVFAVVPIVAALIAGFTLKEVGDFAAKGVASTVKVASLFIFSISYFGVMSDAGMFDSIVKKLAKFAERSVLAVTLITISVAIISHLDGAGATTFLITIPAMLPIYKKMKMRPVTLLLLTSLSLGVVNLVPWGGPTLRAATAIEVDAGLIWRSLIPVQIVGIVTCYAVAVIMARIEVKKGACVPAQILEGDIHSLDDDKASLRRPKLLWFNIILTVVLLISLFNSILPLNITFMIALALALPVNYPNLKEQQERIKQYAPSAMLMASTLLAAGVLLGILSNTKMIDAMAASVVKIIPSFFAPYLHIIVGAFGVPLGMVFGPDPYYYGIMPVITNIVNQYGIADTSVAFSMLIGENVGIIVSPVIPTIYLGMGLAGVELKDNIRNNFLWCWGVSLIMLLSGIIFGIIKIS